MRVAAEGPDLFLEPLLVLFLLVTVVLYLLEQRSERRVGGDAQPRVQGVVELTAARSNAKRSLSRSITLPTFFLASLSMAPPCASRNGWAASQVRGTDARPVV